MKPNAAIQELATIRNQFGRAMSMRKLRLLGLIANLQLDDAKLLREYHELLLFLAAYPDSARLHKQVAMELRRVAGLVNAGCLKSRRFDAAMVDTGIDGSRTTRSFSYDLTTWLTRRFPRDVSLSWDGESAGEALDDFLPSLATRAERDGLLVDRLTTRGWMELAGGARHAAALIWLLKQFDRLPSDPAIRDRAFESLELYIDWVHKGPAASRTLIRFPRAQLFTHSDGLKNSMPARVVIEQPLTVGGPLPLGVATKLLDLCRASLASRGREIDTLTNANPQEVMRIRLDRGIEVAIFGLLPERRLPIESYFGFMVAKNGVPVGYGGGWVFLNRCEIGVNIFETFRGGESAYIFAQVLRAYRHLFDVKRFVVDPYQFGQDNNEAIRSGAFWFYYRLGFRPAQQKLLSLAEEEAARIARKRGYRSPAGVLRRLANSHLIMNLEDNRADRVDDLILGDVGLAVTQWTKQKFQGDSGEATRWALKRTMKAVGSRSIEHWPMNERAAFESLSLLTAMMGDLPRWPKADRQSLIMLMRAKGGPAERRYVRLVQKHGHFARGLADLARRGRRIAAK